MSSEALKNKKIEFRDYDKEPIVVEDYNYIFSGMYLTVGAFVILYFYFINPFGAYNEISRDYFLIHAVFIVIIPGLVYYFQIKKAKRKIILTNENIVFKEEDTVIEKIEVKNIKSVQRTFNDYYMKNQKAGELEALFIFAFLIFNLPIQLMNKFLFHLFKDGIKSYKLFDSIMIFDNEKNFINILPTTNQEWNEIEIYIMKKLSVDLRNSELFFKFNYGNEERKK